MKRKAALSKTLFQPHDLSDFNYKTSYKQGFRATRFKTSKTSWKPDFTLYNSNSRNNRSIFPNLPQIKESTTPTAIA